MCDSLSWEKRWCIYKYSFVFVVITVVVSNELKFSVIFPFILGAQPAAPHREKCGASSCSKPVPYFISSGGESHRCRYSRPAGSFSLSSLSRCLHYTVWLLTCSYFFGCFLGEDTPSHIKKHCYQDQQPTHIFTPRLVLNIIRIVFLVATPRR